MPGLLKPALIRLATGATLDRAEAEQVFGSIMEGEATDIETASLLTALALRGETRDELAGALAAMRARMVPVMAPAGAIDVCGTGGDGARTVNISTAVAFVVAGSGVPVAKHGNRGASGGAGAADVLEALGVSTELPVARLEQLMRTAGAAFLFAPRHHPALRHAAPVRTALGFRTAFNLLGPLANPARVTRQLTGVFSARWLEPMAEALAEAGSERAWLVHGVGLDEFSPEGASDVVALEYGAIRRFTVTPEEAGLRAWPKAALVGRTAAENAASLMALLRGAAGAYRDTVLLNSAAALIVAGRAGDLREGAVLAARALDRGAALAVLEAMRGGGDAPRAAA